MTDPITLRELDEIDVGQLRRGRAKRGALQTVGIESVLDLLTTYPRRWVDRTNEARVADLVPGAEALVLVSVRSVHKRMGRNRRAIVEAVVGDGTGRMHVVFFNQPWRERQLRPDLQVALFGKVDTYRGGLQMANPIVDLIGDRTGRIVPIYPQSEKAQITTWELAGWVENALERSRPRGFCDPVPGAVRRRLGLIDRERALWQIHAGVVEREGPGPPAARLRRAAAGPARTRDAQAGDGARVGRHLHVVDGDLVRRFHGTLAFP